MVAISFGLFTMGLIIMVSDLATLYGRQADATRAAQDAALAGGAVIDVPTFLSPLPGKAHGPVQLLARNGSNGAPDVCEAVGNNAKEGGAATTTCAIVSPDTIEATVTLTVVLPLPIGSPTVTITQKYRAAAQVGTTTPDNNTP